MAFRDRRGNYTILFVLTCSVMLSYLAFSIDGGRMQVAKLDGKNAAEAGALAALAAIRDGADRSDAEVAGAIAANKVSLTAWSISSSSPNAGGQGGTSPGANSQNFEVSVDWGRWNWEAERSTLDARWDQRNDGVIPQAITVNVRTIGGGVGTIFGAALGLASGNTADSKKFSSMQMASGVRAAFRNRDIVVVVDTSRFTEGDIEGIQGGMQSFLDALVDNGVPGDNFAVVAYAGAGWVYDLRNPSQLLDANAAQLSSTFAPHEPTAPFISVHRDHEIARTTLGRVEPCNVGSDAFLHAYRHTLAGEDRELAAPFMDYYAIEPRPSNTSQGQFYWAWDASQETAQSLYRDYWQGQGINTLNQSNWGSALDVPTQCRVWFYLESFPFLSMDPRRDRVLHAAAGVRSPLQCHSGSPYEGRSDSVRRRVDRPIPSVTCGLQPVPETGEPRYNTTDNAPQMYEDRAYYEAGSNPAPGLNRAREVLGNRVSNGEPTVVLITATYPRCGPNVLNTDIPDCDNLFLADTSTALEALDQDKVVTHVIGIAPAGSQSDAQLSTFTTGRGLYQRVIRGDQVGAALTAVARDLRIQVVR